MRRYLNIVLVVGIIDAVLLVALLYVAFVDHNERLVSIFGMIHGVGFVVLVVLTAAGALLRYWGWWFPALVVVTTGPPGTLIGELILRRRSRTAG